MAVYGVDYRTGVARGGKIAFTGWTTILGTEARNSSPVPIGAASGYVQFNGMTQNDDRLAKQFRKSGPTLKIIRQILHNLIGDTAGAGTPTGTVTYKRVQGVSIAGTPAGDRLGGKVPIESIGLNTRNTTAADTTALRAIFDRSVAPASYAVDLSKNGGGGKVKF